jgi:uncharacterized membrane protein
MQRQHKNGMPLPERYPTVFHWWFAFGFPAFGAPWLQYSG